MEEANKLDIGSSITKVEKIRNLTESTYVLRMNRNGLDFCPGQYIAVGKKMDVQRREYSIYSSLYDDYLEILVKEVKGGDVSKSLRRLYSGTEVDLDGPFGFFALKEEDIKSKKFLFIATGTGISPFHSFIKSYKNLDYNLLHGVSYVCEAYERSEYDNERYVLCTSREKGGDFYGRVTHYLKENPIPSDTLVYMCGNSNMIYEAFDILRGQGIPNSNLHSEVYF